MSTYFIGDVHGCYDELMQLLETVNFDSVSDTLVFVGDLINRGPGSLDVLRFVKSLGDAGVVVLGNHDLSFIAYMAGAYHGNNTDFPKMARALDSEILADWLRYQPLMIQDDIHRIAVVHGAIPPQWSMAEAAKHARKAEKRLQCEDFQTFLEKAYDGKSGVWDDELNRYEKFRYRLDGFTRLRYCDESGAPRLDEKKSPGQQSEGLAPWFELRQTYQPEERTTIIFGHWASLGYQVTEHAICIDSGCVWGGSLTALKYENNRFERIQVASLQKSR